jgi:hypothetical protein
VPTSGFESFLKLILLQIIEMAFTRLDLFKALREAKARPLHPSYHEAVLSTVCAQFNLDQTKLSDSSDKKVLDFVTYFVKNVRIRWTWCGRTADRMIEKYPNFFAQEINFDVIDVAIDCGDQTRRTKPFQECGKSSQFQTAAAIRQNEDPDGIVLAATQVFRRKGFNDAAHIMKQMASDPSETPR